MRFRIGIRTRGLATDSGVIASLPINRGLTGEAAADKHISIEKLDGSDFKDVVTRSPA